MEEHHRCFIYEEHTFEENLPKFEKKTTTKTKTKKKAFKVIEINSFRFIKFSVIYSLWSPALIVFLFYQDGVKHLKIFYEAEAGYSFSQARSFPTLQRLITHYRSNDLLENFGYKHMVGVKLKLPFKNA